MNFSLLGRVEAVSDGRLIELGRRQERCLLGLLLLEAGRSVPAPRLAELLWDGSPPESARTVLQTYVSRLRSRLAPWGIPLRGGTGGYRVELAPESVDVHRFCRLTAAAEHIGDPITRAGMLGTALALWQGPVLAGVASDQLSARLGAPLNEVRVNAVQEYARAELECGRAEQAVAVLAEEVAQRPVREPLVGLLMRAFASAGRNGEALALYRQTRDEMVRELGMEPGSELRRVHREVLAHDLRAGQPPAPTGPCELPSPVNTFSGREPERRLIAAALLATGERAPCVVVTGRGGVGKSALAVQVAHDVVDRFPDGQIYVDFWGTTNGLNPRSTSEVLGHCLRSLGAAPAGIPTNTAEAAARLRTLTTGKRILFVLDNVRDATALSVVLPAHPGCAAIVTGRSPLAAVDATARVALETLDESAAARLLARVSGRRFDGPTEHQIIEMCERLPLALRIVGARLALTPELTVAELVTRLADSRRRLDELDVEGWAVRSSIQVSLDALRDGTTAVDKFAGQIFPWLVAIAVPSVSAELAAAIVGHRDPDYVGRAMARLSDLSLLRRLPAGRYGMHDLVRLFAVEQLAHEPVPERDRATRRGFDHFLLTAERVHATLLPHRPPPGEPIEARDAVIAANVDTIERANAWLDAELWNVVAAAQQAASCSVSQPSTAPFALAAGRTLHWLLGKRAAWAEERVLGDIAVQSTLAAAPADRIDALRMRGQAALHQGDWAPAHEALQQAVDLSLDADDAWRRAACLADLARVALATGDATAGRRHLDEGRRIAQAHHSRHLEMVMLLNLSDVEMTSLDWPAALAVLQASLALREPTDLAGIAIVLPALGHVYFELGCPAEALAHLDRAIPLCQRVGNEVDGWYGRLARATLHLSAGAVRPALCDAVQAWRLCSPARAYETASTMRLLGHVTARAGRPLASSTLHHRADDYFRAYDGRANPAVESLLGHAERAASG